MEIPGQPQLESFEQKHQKMIRTAALIGSAIGGVAFIVIGMIVSITTLALPAPQASAVAFQEQLLLVFVVFVAGVIFGAVSGALVGIGTPPYPQLQLKY